MKHTRTLIIFLLILSVISCKSCKIRDNPDSKSISVNSDTVHLNFTVEEAPEWTSLFHRNHGWFGADGIFSIPLNGIDKANASDSTMFLFSDTMIGEIDDGKIVRSRMVNNSVAYLKGSTPDEKNIVFSYAENNNRPQSLFIPSTENSQSGDYYWLGDGFVNQALNGDIYFFAYRMRNIGEGEWNFRQVGNVIIKLPAGSRPPFENQIQIETPFLITGENETDNGSLGAGIFVNTKEAGAPYPDGYIYIYGVIGIMKNLLVSRVLPRDFEDFDKWRFWDGETWNKDFSKIESVTANVSNELSVTPLPDGRYALVFQVNGMSNKVGLRLGLTPYGPFGPIINIWECKETKQKNYITYNAKAHPHLSNPDELLISYNVNAFDFLKEINKNPQLYRPRFIKMKLN